MSRTGVAVKKVITDVTWGRSIVYAQSKPEVIIKPESVVFLKEDTSTENYSLLYFDSSIFASVLMDTIEKMSLLKECNSALRILKTKADMKHLCAMKYSVEQRAANDELEEINPKAIGNEEFKLDKLANDRNYIYQTLVATYLDLMLKYTFIKLIKSVAKIVEQEKHCANLLEDEAKNRETRKELAKQLRQQRNHTKSVNYDTGLKIDQLKIQLNDAALMAEISSRYVSNYQVARTEQHHQAIAIKESTPLVNIEHYKTKVDDELRVHSEMSLLINFAIGEKREMIEKSMEKYDKDIEKMDLKIQIMKNKHTTKVEYRMQLVDTYAKHETLLKDWLRFKEEREKMRQYRVKMTNAATAVQAWWRGLLVRMELGPYKPKKKTAKQKSNKKK